jgi:hypothetical protein
MSRSKTLREGSNVHVEVDGSISDQKLREGLLRNLLNISDVDGASGLTERENDVEVSPTER